MEKTNENEKIRGTTIFGKINFDFFCSLKRKNCSFKFSPNTYFYGN